MTLKKICSNCGSAYHYQTFCPYKKRKPIPKRGKQAQLWETFRDLIAKPYLDKRFGYICNERSCQTTINLDVDHIKTRGAHSNLKFDVKNMQYLCRPHHRQKTDGIELKYKSKK